MEICIFVHENRIENCKNVLFDIHTFIHSFVHSAVCLTTGTWMTLRKPVLHRERTTASCFDIHHLLVSLRSFSSCLHLLPSLHLFRITCYRRQCSCIMSLSTAVFASLVTTNKPVSTGN